MDKIKLLQSHFEIKMGTYFLSFVPEVFVNIQKKVQKSYDFWTFCFC